MTDVLVEVADNVMTITLNRPGKLNAFTTTMYEAVEAAVVAANDDDRVSVVVLRGNGRSFSAGFDRNEPVTDLAAALQITNRCRWAIWDCRVPVVVVTQGHCLGGAFELLHPADLVISADSCVFGMPEVSDGVSAGFNMLPWLTNHKQAKAAMLTAEMFSASDARDRGLVTHLVPADQLDRAVEEVVGRMRAVPTATLAAIKAQTNGVYEKLGIRQMIDDDVASHSGMGLFNG